MAKEPVDGSTPGGSYSPGIVAEGRFMYVSGQAAGRDGQSSGGSVADQTTVAVQNLAGVLAAAGATLADAVRCGSSWPTWPTSPPWTPCTAASSRRRDRPGPRWGPRLPGIQVEIDYVAVLPGRGAR